MSTITAPPRVAAIHDLSCFGRCALTVIMPTLSVMGYQVVPIPTALLSTHTGGFTDLHFHDLTDDMEAIAAHFEALGTSFRAIYTGFLGSAEQIETVSKIIDRFGTHKSEDEEQPLILIDPVMGDDGELYSTYTPELVRGIRRLSRHAQLLTPNLTEACLLTDTPYRDTADMDPDDALAFCEACLEKLTAVTAGRIVITGISLADGTLANLGRDADDTRFCIRRPHEPHSYPGTGDLFASVLLGALLRGESFPEACATAAGFTSDVIHASIPIPTPNREGVALEPQLWRLLPQAKNAEWKGK
ncbi:MAG: pyridoxamine kinase [Clostridia bacterium]|nr:pyridoxamine kinase [Clostridia bacterium]